MEPQESQVGRGRDVSALWKIEGVRREIRSLVAFARRRRGFFFGLIIVVVSLFLMVFGLSVAPFDPEEALPEAPLQPPSREHWMGTDLSGMDIFSRVISAPRIDLIIALGSTFIALTAGTFLGVIAGYFEGRGIWGTVSTLIMRGADVLNALPVFIFALALVGFRGPSMGNVIASLAFLNIPFFIRVTRSTVLGVRERPFVEAARAAGNSELGIAFRHVMPNALTAPLANVSPTVGYSILLTAGLSFLGAGVPKPTPEWGSMISVGAPNMMTGQWWPAFFPGIVLTVTILGYAIVGDGLRDYLDPTKRV